MARGRPPVLVAILVAVMSVGGCSSQAAAPDASPPAPTVPAAEVVAAITQTREDIAAGGRLQILVTNAGRQPFTLTSVRLDSPGFRAAEARAGDDAFPPGTRYSLPTAYGAAICDVEAVPARAVVVLHRDGAPDASLSVPVSSDDGLLARIHASDCRERELRERVGLELVNLKPDGDGLRGALRVTRGTQVGPVTLTELRGTVLFGWGPLDPAVLDAGSARLDVPVRLTTVTCSGHVIGETKQPYLFTAYLALGGDPPAALQIPVTAAQKDLLQALIRHNC